MTDKTGKKSNHISRYIQKVNVLLDTIRDLKDLTDEAVELGYDTNLKDEDFVGSNEFLSANDYQGIVKALQGLDKSCSDGDPSIYAVLRGMRS